MKWFKNGSLFESDTVSLRVFQVRKEMNSQKCSRENWKCFKNCPICAKHTFFTTESSRVQVARASRQNTWKKTFEKFSKCFSWLEVPLARESRSEPRKSLCTPHDRTFHPRTSHQLEPRKAWKPKFFEKNSKSFSQLKHLSTNESLVSRKKSLYGLAIGACDWYYPRLRRQNRATCFWNFDKFS